MPLPNEHAFLAALPLVPRDVDPSRIFKRVEKIGKGAFGSVYKALHIPTSFVVALKIIDLDTQDDDTADIQREVGMLQSMTRNGDAEKSNVTRYFGCWMEGPKVWIAMDYAGGGSLKTLREAGHIEEKFIVLIVREVLVALSYLNRVGIIHRDIKGANVLLTSAPRVVLCDFGVSAPLFLSSSNTSKRTTFVGTPYWMAPEVLLGRPYDTKADIWGLGITVLEIADKDGEPPHAKEDAMRVIMMIPKMKPPKLPENENWSREMREFLAGCLNEQPDERSSADDLLKTKWIKSALKLPLTPLNELLRRVDAYKGQQENRKSMAVSIYGEDSEFGLDGENDWQFNTFKPSEGFPYTSSPPSPSLAPPTLRQPSAPAKTAPNSLRRLFEDVNAPVDPFRSGPGGGGLSPSPGGFLAYPNNNNNATRSLDEDSRSNTIRPGAAAVVAVGIVEPKELEARLDVENDDVIAARNGLRFNSDKEDDLRVVDLSNSPDPSVFGLSSDQESTRSDRLAASRSPSPLKLPNYGSNPASISSPSFTSNSTYRDVRNSKGLANIAIPPPPAFTNERVDGLRSGSPLLARSPGTMGGLMPEGMSPRRGRSASQGLAGGSSPSSPVTRGPPPPARNPLPTSVASSSSSTIATKRMSHAPSASLDSSPTRNYDHPPSDLSLSPSFLNRRHIGEHESPTKPIYPPQRPFINRQASVAVMETVSPPHPVFVPLRAGISRSATGLVTAPVPRARSHSRTEIEGFVDVGRHSPLPPPTPSSISRQQLAQPQTSLLHPPAPPSLGGGLKDMLKLLPVGPDMQSDLLPPSPSASSSAARFNFIPMPSPLNGTLSSFHHPSTTTPSSSPLPGSSTFLQLHTSQSDQNLRRSASPYALPIPTPQPPPPLMAIPNEGPPIRPLDYAKLVTQKDVVAQLERTVADLGKWLEIVDAGLGGMLDAAFTYPSPSRGTDSDEEAGDGTAAQREEVLA